MTDRHTDLNTAILRLADAQDVIQIRNSEIRKLRDEIVRLKDENAALVREVEWKTYLLAQTSPAYRKWLGLEELPR